MNGLLNEGSKENKARQDRRPLTVIAFMDGRPGHEKQTLGVLRALGGLTPIAVTRQPVRPLSTSTAIKSWLRYAVGLAAPHITAASPADFVIGTGSGTHIPMLLYKKKFAVRVVTCMTPDRLLRRRIDLCLVPHHDDTPPAANVFYTTGPPNDVIRCERHDGRAGLILVGGLDPKSHHWRTDDLSNQVDAILKKNQDVRWTLSSSPRTPADTCMVLEKLVSRYPSAVFFRSEDTPRGWVEAQYARCDRVWVTADSVSMVFEALTAGCRVGVLPVAWKRSDNKFVRGLDDLQRRGMIIYYTDWIRGNTVMIRGEPLEEAANCAKEILRRWWPDRLP